MAALVNRKQAAEHLGISTSLIRKRLKCGTYSFPEPKNKVGKRELFYDLEEVEAWYTKCRGYAGCGDAVPFNNDMALKFLTYKIGSKPKKRVLSSSSKERQIQRLEEQEYHTSYSLAY